MKRRVALIEKNICSPILSAFLDACCDTKRKGNFTPTGHTSSTFAPRHADRYARLWCPRCNRRTSVRPTRPTNRRSRHHASHARQVCSLDSRLRAPQADQRRTPSRRQRRRGRDRDSRTLLRMMLHDAHQSPLLAQFDLVELQRERARKVFSRRVRL